MNLYLKKEFGVKYPVIQGGMANIATAEFAAVIANAGGIGLVGTGGWTIDQAKVEIDKAFELVEEGKVFGVNVMMMNPFAEAIIDYCIERGVKLITTGAGSPGPYVDKIHEAGIKIFPVVPSVVHAIKMERMGVDAIIVEGTESGGHVGEMTTLTLVPQVINAVNVPVIAAGGIATPRQFLAAIALGAEGIQIGTVLLATEECPIHENYKAEILKAKDNSTIVTGRSKGVPVRALKNQMARKYAKLEVTDVDPMELEHLTLGSLRKAVFDGNVKEGSFMAGQVVGEIKEIKTVAQVLAEICTLDEVFSKLERKINE
ncbi:MAG: nitronate monooxygenase [Mycoplasmatales bacterium]